MPTKVYFDHDTTYDLKWAGTGTRDGDLTLASLGSDAGRQGEMLDMNLATARPLIAEFRFWCKFNTAPVPGEIILIKEKTGDGTITDGDSGEGTGDAAVTAEGRIIAYDTIGMLRVPHNVTTNTYSTHGTIKIKDEFWGPVIWNATADALSSTEGDMGFTLKFLVPEVQD